MLVAGFDSLGRVPSEDDRLADSSFLVRSARMPTMLPVTLPVLMCFEDDKVVLTFETEALVFPLSWRFW